VLQVILKRSCSPDARRSTDNETGVKIERSQNRSEENICGGNSSQERTALSKANKAKEGGNLGISSENPD